MKKKMIAAVLTAAQLASVSFVTTKSYAEIIDSYEWDFEDYTENSDYGILKAMGTKGENDKIAPEVISEEYGKSAKLIATNDNMFFDANFAKVSELTDSYVMSISYDLYTGDYNANKSLALKINNTTYHDFVMVATNGTLKLNGSWYGAQNLIPKADWRNFEVKLYYGTTKAEIYLQGEKIKDLTLPETISTVNGFRFVDYKSNVGTVMGLDNVKIKIKNLNDELAEKYNCDFNSGNGNYTLSSAELKSNIGYKGESDKAVYIGNGGAVFYANKVALTDNAVYHLSFDWYIPDYNSQKSLAMHYTKPGETSSTADWNFFRINTNQQVVFGGWHNNKLQTAQWQKYDIYVSKTTADGAVKNTVKVYIDGVMLCEKQYENAIDSIDRLTFSTQASQTAEASELGLDNIKVTLENSEKITYPDEALPKYYDFSNNYTGIIGNVAVKYGESDGGLFAEEVLNNQKGRKSFYHIGTKAGGTYTVANRWGNEEELSVASGKTLASGDTLHFGESIMFSDMSGGINITSYMNGVQRNDNLVLEIAKDGSAKAFGTALSGITFRENTWYKLDYIITACGTEKANMADVYIDGRKINSEPISFATLRNSTENTLLTSFKIGNLIKSIGGEVAEEDGTFKITPTNEQNMYFDDIYMDIRHNAYDVADPAVKLIYNGEILMIENGNTVIGVGDVTVSEFLNTVICENGSVSVVDETGAAVANGYLNDYYIKIKKNNGGYIFAKTQAVNYDNYMIYNGFDEGIKIEKDFLIPNRQTPRYEAGVALKEENNNAVFFDLASGETSAIIQNVAEREITDNFVLETSIYTPKSNGAVHVQLKINEAAINSYLIFDSDNAIKLLGGEVVGSWKGGRWYKTALVFNRQNGLMDLYINGVCVKQGKKINADSIEKIKTLRYTYLAATDINTTCGFDDIKMYRGEYDSRKDYLFVKARSYSSGSLDRVVFIDKDIAKDEFIAGFNIVGNAAIYDKDMHKTDTASDGCILVVKSKNADNIDYYDIVDVTKRSFVGKIQVVDSNGDIPEMKEGTVTAKAVVGTTQSIDIIAALYEDGRLVKTSRGTLSANGTLSTDIIIDDAQKQSLKVFVWSSLDDMAPYGNARTVASKTK